MTIRLKMLLAILAGVAITLAGVTCIVSFELTKVLTSDFRVNSKAQLDRVSGFVDLFFDGAMADAKFLAMHPLTTESVGTLSVYKDTTTPCPTVGAKLPEGERQLYFELQRLQAVNSAYDLVIAADERGGITQAPDDTLTAGYNSAIRPWFIESLQKNKPVITEAYLSDTGVMVCSVTTPVTASGNGTGRGVISIDISLKTLTEELSKATIGKTGYMMLLDESGQIIADPKHSHDSIPQNARWLGKPVSDLPRDAAMALQRLKNKKEGIDEIVFDSKTWLAGVTTTKQGWTLIMLQEKDEIFADAMSISLSIFEVGLFIMLGMSGVAYLLSRSIAGPVSVLADAAEQVAAGDFTAIPKDGKGFNGELKILHNSLQSMVGKLVELIGTAETKVKEAENALALSAASLKEAEAAKAQAEVARKEGVMQTADRLSHVVHQLSDSAGNLFQELAGTETAMDKQRLRVGETAAAMDQMNIAVGEVAKSISLTAQLADQAREEAQEGRGLFQEVANSIGEVEQQTLSMRASLEHLGTHVAGIDKIINVIDEIADQTNLLALNAAIEAARAGDAGRGFAVVAGEVRKLAEKTIEATKQVGESIRAIQNGTNDNLKIMYSTAGFVEKSATLANRAGEALSDIEDIVSKTADEIRSIATASEEQSETSAEINRGTQEVSLLADQVSDGARRSNEAVGALSKLAQHLENIVDSLHSS